MLILNEVSKTFNPGTVNAKLALDKLTLHIHKGDFVSIIGANGAGKSTLFNAICGSFFVDAGAVYLDGKKRFTGNRGGDCGGSNEEEEGCGQ